MSTDLHDRAVQGKSKGIYDGLGSNEPNAEIVSTGEQSLSTNPDMPTLRSMPVIAEDSAEAAAAREAAEEARSRGSAAADGAGVTDSRVILTPAW